MRSTRDWRGWMTIWQASTDSERWTLRGLGRRDRPYGIAEITEHVSSWA